jgi:rhodanese-related sulfurtransferase
MLERLRSLFSPGPPVPLVTAPELHKQLKGKQKPFLLDVRSPREFQGGYIAGSTLIPLGELPPRSGELPKNHPIVCVCASGRRSKKACRQLMAGGFQDVVNLSGGMRAWRQAKLPVRTQSGRT